MPQHELHMLGFWRTSFPGAGSRSPQQMQMAGFTLLVSRVHISLLHPSFQIERSYKKFSHLAQAVAGHGPMSKGFEASKLVG
jgi:hypothetical protein